MSLPVAILAGGLATRLRPLTEDIPKSLVEVAGKPFIVHQLELLRHNGVQRVILCVGYLGEMIRDLLGDGRALGMHIDYVFDGSMLLGTGGALKQALPILGDVFFVLYGDSYLEIDYRAVHVAYDQDDKLGLMTVYRNDGQWDRSNVLFEDGRIVRYDKRRPTPDMCHIDYGLGVLRTEALTDVPSDQAYDLANVYVGLLARDQLAGFEVNQRFYEIGSPTGLEETRRYLSTRKA